MQNENPNTYQPQPQTIETYTQQPVMAPPPLSNPGVTPPNDANNQPEKKPKKKSHTTFVVLAFLLVIGTVILMAKTTLGATFTSPFEDPNEYADDPSDADPTEKVPEVKEPENANIIKLCRHFNALESVKEFNNSTGTMTCEVNDKTLTVSVTETGKKLYKYTYKKGILSNESPIDDEQARTVFKYLTTAKAVEEGQDETTVNIVLSDSSASKMTLEVHGSQTTVTEKNRIFKLDLSKDLALIDLNKEIVTSSTLEPLKEVFTKGGNISGNAGSIVYSFTYNPNESNKMTIIIAEPDEFTSLTYNSLLAFVDAIFGETESTNFKALYPAIVSTTFDKYTIVTNPSAPTYQTYYDDNYKVLEVIINK